MPTQLESMPTQLESLPVRQPGPSHFAPVTLISVFRCDYRAGGHELGGLNSATGEVGAFVRDRRRALGMTQGQLAIRAGISIASLRDLEQGRVMRPRRASAKRLAAALNLSEPERHELDGAAPGLTDSEPMARVPLLRRAQVAAGLRIDILGPLRVSHGGTELRVGAAGQRGLLGLLGLHPHTGLSRAMIVEALWGDRPPHSAAGIIHSHVSRLRSLLDAEHDGSGGSRFLVRDGAGYRLRVTEVDLDLQCFRLLVQRARKARMAAETGAACAAYERALVLWRGEPLADVPALQDHPAVIALREERATVTLEYADVASDSGWHGKSLPYLREQTARDPLDEGAHARLMIALAGSGRQAQALRVHEDIRYRLAEQLGVDPGAELREAHARVLRQEVAAAPDLSGSRRPLFQLPATLADFVGRAAVSEKLATMIVPADQQHGVPLVVISGMPGVGKTALALHVAHHVREQFPDGQLWLELGGSSGRPRDPASALEQLTRALGIAGVIPPDRAELAAHYRTRLAGRKVLVVADDAAAAAQVQPLLPGTRGCAVIVTSRSRLEDLAGAAFIPLDVMSDDAASGLLASIVGGERVAAEPAAAAQLARDCGNLPLALRVIGSKLAVRPSLPLSAMVNRLTTAHGRLRELEAGSLSVRGSIASSYEQLSEPARGAFRLLALLGPADFAEWVIGALLGESDAADVLAELVSMSLLAVTRVDNAGEPRYRLNDLLRDYADELLDHEPAAVRDAALDRLLAGHPACEARQSAEPCVAIPMGPGALMLT
jgi:DNA-binding SARP family transcriptional activator/DNA-binding XRE family transcriptional regulator